MKASLQLKLGQHLALTPQLQQSIRLLQLSTLELNQEVEQALADNPLLECDEDPAAVSLRISSDGAIVDRPAAVAADPAASDVASASENERPDSEFGALDWGHRSNASADDDDAGPSVWASAGPTLAQHLLAQLGGTQVTPKDHALVEMLVDALDENGYLTSPLEELHQLCPPEADVDIDDLATALTLLQSFDPPGVGARSPSESLLLQLNALSAREGFSCSPRVLGLSKSIVREHLQLMAGHDYGKLRRLLGASEDELRAADQLIRGLNPHPGVGFGEQTVEYVVPDIYVRKNKGRWVAHLNSATMPRLHVNLDFAAIVKRDRSLDGGAAWTTRLQEARWLIRNIQQRFDTILRVARAIVERQQSFFSHGAMAMRPLVLREIADTVGLHESTVSRVTSGKYMSTPFGIFELKYFFGSHVATDSGGAASSTAIRALIKQLVGAENPKDPMSDSQIAELLGEQGFVVARRTVAKYRESLKIPPVAMRKVL
jgi:RNA polymerase sigma-54 factor